MKENNKESNEDLKNGLADEEVTEQAKSDAEPAEENNEEAPKKNVKLSKSEQIKELQYEKAELNDKYLRLFSEFDNFRKRINKEKIDIIKTASKDVIEGLLPVLDDFDRALQHLKDLGSDEETIKGVELIYNKLFNNLKSKGLEPMDSKGKEFDTDFHDAITQIPAPAEDLKGKVVDVAEKGYLLNGTIIRHAKVIVGV
jgi:molecular chaperone GrpE